MTPDPAAPAAAAGDDLWGDLRADPTSFSFFQAVRLLERSRRDATRVGHFGDPAAEAVRFTVTPALAFPASEIQALEAPGSAASRMTVNFLGLTGPQGVLPYWYTLLVMEQLRSRHAALASFLDLFQGRAIGLFYRAWEKARPFAALERAEVDRATMLLRSAVGLPPLPGEGAPVLAERVLTAYAGLFGSHRRTAVGLEQLITGYFGVSATVEQFVGGWFPVPAASRCRLGEGEDQTTQLGVGVVAGDEVWDPQVRVRLRLGPLSRAQYDAFLPPGAAHGELRDLTRLYCGDEVDVECQLVLRSDAVPRFVLGDDGGDQRLGWSTWIRTGPLDRDADDTTLTLS